MDKRRQLLEEREQRRIERSAAQMAGLDWLNGRPSKARSRIARLIELLKTADLLSNELQRRKLSLPASTPEAHRLLNVLHGAGEILEQYRGTRIVWVDDDYSLQELFGLDAERLQRDDNYEVETRVLNYALELLRNGSIQRIRTCRECKKWYYATTNGQASCSPTCRQRFYAHSEQFRQQRRAYMREYRRQETQRNKRAQSLARRTK